MSGVTRFLHIMEVNGLLARPKPAFYIYKFVCTLNGKFYVSQTKDLDLRITAHIDNIIKILKGSDEYSMPFYKQFSDIIHQEYVSTGSKKTIQNFTMRSCSIELLAVIQTKEAADIVEIHYKDLYKNDPLCLNIFQKK